MNYAAIQPIESERYLALIESAREECLRALHERTWIAQSNIRHHEATINCITEFFESDPVLSARSGNHSIRRLAAIHDEIATQMPPGAHVKMDADHFINTAFGLLYQNEISGVSGRSLSGLNDGGHAFRALCEQWNDWKTDHGMV